MKGGWINYPSLKYWSKIRIQQELEVANYLNVTGSLSSVYFINPCGVGVSNQRPKYKHGGFNNNRATLRNELKYLNTKQIKQTEEGHWRRSFVALKNKAHQCPSRY